MLRLLLLFALLSSAAQAQTVVVGRVVDGAGAGLPSAGVQIVGTIDGAATDRDGHFSFRTRATGRQVARASMLGMESDERALELAGDTVRVRFILRSTLIELGEAVVTAAFTTGDAEAVTLSPLEVVTTPGAAADLFRAIQSFPGVTTVGDGAGLYVRGGMPSETRTLIDGAFVSHPYKYESPTDGAFGTIPPFLVAGSSFASGGFGARWGNALSAVLDLDTPDLPTERTASVTAGLAGGGGEVSAPIVPGSLGLRVTGNRSATDLLFAVNGRDGDFETTPRGSDGSVSLTYAYGDAGRVKLFGFGATDRLGVLVDEPTATGTYRSTSERALGALSWQDVWGDLFVEATLAANRYGSRRTLGALDLRPTESGVQARVDVERTLSKALSLRGGGEFERGTSRFEGTIPVGDDLLAPGAPVYTLDERVGADRVGGYVEASVQPLRALVVTAGLRADRHTPSDQTVVDPRVEAVWAASDALRFRAAWGVYHQFGAPFDYNAESGNPRLKAARAEHWIAGAFYTRDLLTLRAEAYAKPYRNLAIETADAPLDAVGTGFAQGIDLFAQYGAFLRTRANGWISYSFLQAERDQTRRLGQAVDVQRGPAPFDVRHNLSVVGKVRVVGFWYVGGAIRWASGAPHTPIVRGEESGGYWSPVEGDVGSERLPSFARADLQVSHYWPIRDGLALTVFGALSNATNRPNALGYTYSADYASRALDLTTFTRSAFAGFTLAYTR